MSNPEQRPVQWVFAPPRKRHPGRIVLLIVLILIVVAVAAGAVYLALPKGTEDAAPTPTPSATPTAAATATASASPTASPVQTSEPATPTPVPTSTEVVPEPEVPDVSDFAATVSPRLDDATTGLGFIAEGSASEAVEVAEQLILDAQILSDEVAPDAIATAWRETVTSYLSSLNTLKNIASAGEDITDATADAQQQLAAVRALVGL